MEIKFNSYINTFNIKQIEMSFLYLDLTMTIILATALWANTIRYRNKIVDQDALKLHYFGLTN